MQRSRDDREQDKFVETYGGKTAVRVFIADAEGIALISSKFYINAPISALKLVRAIDKNTVEVADADLNDLALSTSFGLSLQGGPTGSLIDVATFGKVEDAFFNFPNGTQLYLGSAGAIVATPPTTGFLLPIGYSMGAGAIFINISKPILRR
jgi:hypothetical protein